MTNLMIKAIKYGKKLFKGKGLEIRTVSFLEGCEDYMLVRIEYNLLLANKYYFIEIKTYGNKDIDSVLITNLTEIK